MGIIDFLIFICVVIILIKVLYVFFSLFDIFIKKPVAGEKPLFVPKGVNRFLFSTLRASSSSSNHLFVPIILIFLIFYMIYLAIKLLVPDTGFATLFIPLKELLLSIPPLPQLEKAGIFRLFSGIGKAFGLPTAIQKVFGFNRAVLIFTQEHIKNILRSIFPNIDYDNIMIGSDNDDNSIASSEDEEEKKEEIEPRKKKIYNKIENDTKICALNNYKHITPDMDKNEIMAIEFKNTNSDSKCGSKSLPKYILS
jgi:hypothetical protein